MRGDRRRGLTKRSAPKSVAILVGPLAGRVNSVHQRRVSQTSAHRSTGCIFIGNPFFL